MSISAKVILLVGRDKTLHDLTELSFYKYVHDGQRRDGLSHH
jgi:hypothetical protein